jgi:hypothetical protein
MMIALITALYATCIILTVNRFRQLNGFIRDEASR